MMPYRRISSQYSAYACSAESNYDPVLGFICGGSFIIRRVSFCSAVIMPICFYDAYLGLIMFNDNNKIQHSTEKKFTISSFRTTVHWEPIAFPHENPMNYDPAGTHGFSAFGDVLDLYFCSGWL